MTARYIPEFGIDGPALSSHADLRRIIISIRARPTLSRDELVATSFRVDTMSAISPPLAEGRRRALNMAASLMLLLNCGSPYDHANYSDDVLLPLEWDGDASITDLMNMAFPESRDVCIDDLGKTWNNQEGKAKMSARNLRKEAGITFRPTNDLRRHLVMDPITKVVSIFHYTAVLHEILAAHEVARNINNDTEHDTSPKPFMLPRSLALEALDTIHEILFPSDHESQALLESLMNNQGVGGDLERYKWACYQPEAKRKYPYFGERLSTLYEEVLDPSPRNALELWLEKKSSSKNAQRNMLLVTMIGVILTVVVGFFSLVVAVFSGWIAWQQWKHPVTGGSIP
jgi:hypothetical protein